MKIAYNDINNNLKLITSAINNINIKIIADKDVPHGVLYKLVDESELPSRDTRNFWTMEINNDNADGIGLTKEEFDKKYPEYSGWAVK